MIALCLQCQNPLSRQLTLTLGDLPACNRFKKKAQTASEKHPVSISVCSACNLVQLSKFPPVGFVRPRVPWIQYNEPTVHLAHVSQRLLKLLSNNATKIMGIGPFDSLLLEKLVHYAEFRVILDIAKPTQSSAEYFPYLESIQELLRPESLSKMAIKQGTADLVSCRYLLEHSHAPIATLQALHYLLKPDGLLLIEVPDSSKFIGAFDYSFIWEEHICYFTESTLYDCARRAGYQVIDFQRHKGVLEDALVFVLQATGLPIGNNETQRKIIHTDQFEHYIHKFVSVRAQYQLAIENIQGQFEKVALFGAGHQSIMFINALELQAHISCVIDDCLNKEGLFIPGTSIPIVSSERFLADQSISVCLLGINPALENKIRIKCAAFLDRGGKIYSIFPGSSLGTLIDHQTDY
ncbi:MAG TPA: SAM-dependent methyltransferase [Rhodobacteraceae bacterium]|nr:SAM-dependent methyltransferase [Paracoccaceae bacterium]